MRDYKTPVEAAYFTEGFIKGFLFGLAIMGGAWLTFGVLL